MSVFTAWGAPAEPILARLQAGLTLKDARLPLYTDPPRVLTMIISAKAAYMDYEKRGFFRIGALPITVFDGITFSAQTNAFSPHSLHEITRALGVTAGNHAELRHVTFIPAFEGTLQAARVKCMPDGQWRLTETVFQEKGRATVRAPRGTLFLEGPRAGQLVLESSPIFTCQFLTVSESKTNSILEP